MARRSTKKRSVKKRRTARKSRRGGGWPWSKSKIAPVPAFAVPLAAAPRGSNAEKILDDFLEMYPHMASHPKLADMIYKPSWAIDFAEHLQKYPEDEDLSDARILHRILMESGQRVNYAHLNEISKRNRQHRLNEGLPATGDIGAA